MSYPQKSADLHPHHTQKKGKSLLWMDEILHHLATIVCWYLQGNQIIPGSLRLCERISSIHSMNRIGLSRSSSREVPTLFCSLFSGEPFPKKEAVKGQGLVYVLTTQLHLIPLTRCVAPAFLPKGPTYPLKLQALKKLIFYRHIAHVTPKKSRQVSCF